MNRRSLIGSAALLVVLVIIGGVLAAWKYDSIQDADSAAANQPEPIEAIAIATATPRQHRQTTTSIGTVLALRSITLRNEEPGTVREVKLVPGQIVEAGAVLVALDVTVEQAELRSQEAQAALAETMLGRVQRARQNDAVSEMEVDRARAERDVALAQIARIKAIIDRKTIYAPFRARVGLADVHPGQYLEAGTLLTTLQGVDDPPAVHVDFTVAQQVAAGLREGDVVEVVVAGGSDAPPVQAKIVALDARIDQTTRNAMVRARIESAPGSGNTPVPGASVRVRVPAGPPQAAAAVPVSAVRKGPAGDHVFVIASDQNGKPRAHLRPVQSGAMLGDEILVHEGLAAGEQVAASGSFKLREGVLVAIASEPSIEPTAAR